MFGNIALLIRHSAAQRSAAQRSASKAFSADDTGSAQAACAERIMKVD
jgi:hypothetical protein